MLHTLPVSTCISEVHYPSAPRDLINILIIDVIQVSSLTDIRLVQVLF